MRVVEGMSCVNEEERMSVGEAVEELKEIVEWLSEMKVRREVGKEMAETLLGKDGERSGESGVMDIDEKEEGEGEKGVGGERRGRA